MKKIFINRILDSVWICMLICFWSASLSSQCPTPQNISQGKAAQQSSTYGSGYVAGKAVDGYISSNNTEITSTLSELQPWWEVDLVSSQMVNSIEITVRMDCCGDRIKRFKVFVSSTPITSYSNSTHVYLFDMPSGMTLGQVITIPNINVSGRYVKIWVDNTGYGNNYFSLNEVKVFCFTGGGSNIPPTVNITSPTSGASFPVGGTVNFNANASDQDGSVSKVEFYDGSTLLGEDQTSPYTLAISSLTVGSHSITAKATDNQTAATTSSAINITINSATCSDLTQNGTETGIDCGGSCAACPTGGNSWAGSTSSTGNVYRAGRVGIGGTGSAFTFPSSETDYNLLVKGGIKAEKFKVELPSTGGWADYVFQEDYKQLPLRKVELFIKTNKHLPGFPSESQIIKSGGYEISNMIKQQQESIENLYLYIIELEKKLEMIKDLEKRISQIEMNQIKLK